MITFHNSNKSTRTFSRNLMTWFFPMCPLFLGLGPFIADVYMILPIDMSSSGRSFEKVRFLEYRDTTFLIDTLICLPRMT
jgi:hypothetical protein